MRKPWFRRQNQTWYVFDAATGKQVALGQDRDKAFEAWGLRLAAPPPAGSPDVLLATILEKHLEWVALHQAPRTYDWKLSYLDPFAADCGMVRVADLKRYHLTRWLDERQYSDGARRAAITAVKAAMNWAVDEEYITSNPFARVKRPPVRRRETLIEPADLTRILARADRHFRLFTVALAHTGCRPRQVREVTAANFHPRLGTWVFAPDEHKTGRKTGRKLVVHLTPCMVTLSRILAAARPDGPLFRNRLRRPWTVNAVRCRMRRMREFLGLPAGTVAYSFRHTFTTNGLTNGVDVATMAQLLGHADTAMIDRYYGHLDQRQDHLRKAVQRVRASSKREDQNGHSDVRKM